MPRPAPDSKRVRAIFAKAIDLPEGVNLGPARIDFRLIDGDDLTNTSTSHAFEVQEFRRPEFEVSARVGEEGKLFGSVTSVQIAELLAEKGFEIDRRKIGLDEPIKEAGEHKVPIRLRGELAAEVKLVVTPEE